VHLHSFYRLLQVVYGVCLKEWGKFTEMKNQRREAERRSKKAGV
jgi:hypothetical protein